MRWAKYFVLIAALSCVALCADRPQGTVLLPCGEGSGGKPNCNPSKSELKEAKSAYKKGLKLQNSKELQAAFEEFDKAAELVPRNIEYLTTRELVRQQLVSDHMESGNKEMLAGKQAAAIADFREALNLDPDNQYAQERMQDAVGRSAPRTKEHPQVVEDAGELKVNPKTNVASFHFRGDTKSLLAAVVSVYGLTAIIDDSVMSRHVRFDLGDADFYTAMGAACAVAHCFWSPVAKKQIIIAADTPDNRRHYERMSLRTFYIPGATTPAQLNEIAGMLRSVFEMRFVTLQPQASKIEVRAPQGMLDAATKILEGLDDKRPQIMLDVHVYEVSESFMRNLGVHIPNQFTLFNIPVAALAALGGQNIQDLINQLISSGGINQANSQAISALLAQLGSQQNSIFSQPLATFGGGLTLFGLTLDNLSATASLNESSIKSLEHATFRASEGNEGSLHIGTRYPILNASFAPIFNSPQISSVIQNNSFTPAFPSFNYEDLGLTIKAKPLTTTRHDVSLNIELQVRSLGTASLNGVPVISNREYKGSINLADGEPAVVAGSMSHSEQRGLSGIPGFGEVPGLNRIAATEAIQNSDDELLVVITPQVISASEGESAAVWLAR